MTAISHDPRDARAAWANRRLDASGVASAGSPRERFLRLLGEREFLPDPIDWGCYGLLASPSEQALIPAAEAEYERSLRAEIEGYADRFFQLPMPIRRA